MKRQTLLRSIGIAAVCIGVLFFFFSNKKPEKKIIAFSGLPEPTATAVYAVLKEQYPTLEERFTHEIIPDTESAEIYLKTHPQTAFIITINQKSLFDIQESCILQTEAPFHLLPSTFQNSIFSGADRPVHAAFPLLIDGTKYAYHIDKCEKLGIRPAATVEALEAAMQLLKQSDTFPLICEGGNDTALLAMVSMTAAILGIDLGGSDLSSLTPPFNLVNNIPDPLRPVLEKLTSWRQQGWLHPEWYNLVEQDIRIFMEFGGAGIVCMPLSLSRQLPQDILRLYETAQPPLPTTLKNKNAPADIIAVARLIASKDDPDADAVEAVLQSQVFNEKAATATGLAPVFASAKTDDGDSSSVRYWAAASNKVLPNLGNLCCAAPAEQTQFAAALRLYFQVDGLGYGDSN